MKYQALFSLKKYKTTIDNNNNNNNNNSNNNNNNNNQTIVCCDTDLQYGGYRYKIK